MTHGIFGAHGLDRREGEGPRLVEPVERGADGSLAYETKPFGEPEVCSLVAPIAHEVEIFAVGHEARRDRKWLDPDPVARPLVVEGEGAPGGRALGGAYGDQAGVQRNEAQRIGARARHVTRRPVRGPHRVLKERVLDVREQELLVLHLVVQSELDAVDDLGAARSFERGAHALVDRSPVVQDFGHRGAREHAAPVARMTVAHGVVIRVEEEREAGVIRRRLRKKGREHELLEKPGGVGEVPLHGARVRHGLNRHVLVRERLDEGLGTASRGRIAGTELEHFAHDRTLSWSVRLRIATRGRLTPLHGAASG